MYEIFSSVLLYVCISLTPVVTAVIATTTFITYYKHLHSFLTWLKTHLEDWAYFWFTVFWLLFVNQPYTLLVLWRWSVKVFMKLRYGELGDIATGADSTGSLDRPESRQIIKSLKVLQGKCDIQELRRRVEQTACKRDATTGKFAHPKFHQYLEIVGGYYCWRPAKQFDINYYVRFADGLDESSESLGEKELLEVISKYSNTAFQEGRSLWEILVIPRIHYNHEEGKDTKEEKFAILVRLSHGIGDGFSFLKLVMRDMAGTDVEDYVPPHNHTKSSWLRKIGTFFYLAFKAPRAFYQQLNFTDCNPLHNPEIEMSGEKVHAWSKPVDVEWLKLLKTKLGCGMNTILLNTLSSACRRYMISRGLPESDLPKNMYTIIPVPAPNHPNDKLVNKFSIVMLPLELQKPNTLQRCQEIERENRIMNMSPYCYLNIFLMDLLSVFHVSFTRFLIVNKQCTAVISNLPGPKKSINIWGYPMVDTMFWLPNVGTSGVSVSYLSYERKMRFGICVDAAAVPERKEGADLLLEWMIEDLKLLAASVNIPHDEETMFINIAAESSIIHKVDNNRDKDEVGSDDCGYGGEPSDISSQADTDEDVEELTAKLGVEGPTAVPDSNNNQQSEKENCNVEEEVYSPERDVDQRFLMTHSATKSQKNNAKRRGGSRILLNASSIC